MGLLEFFGMQPRAGLPAVIDNKTHEIIDERQERSVSVSPDLRIAQKAALLKTASEIRLNNRQIERLNEEDYNDYIANLNQQAQAVYYARLADALEDQRLEAMQAQAQAQNKVYEQRAQAGRQAQAIRAQHARAQGVGYGGIGVMPDGTMIDCGGAVVYSSDLSDFGIFE